MAAKRKPVSRHVALAELQRRADIYADLLVEKMGCHGRMSIKTLNAIWPLIVEFAKLRIAFTAHLNGEK